MQMAVSLMNVCTVVRARVSRAEGMYRNLKKKERQEHLFQYRWKVLAFHYVSFYKVFSYITVHSKMTYKEQHTVKYKIKKKLCAG